MENKYENKALDVSRDWMTDVNNGAGENLTYAGEYKTSCGAPACWALINTFENWAFVDGIDADFEIVEDEEQGELGIMDYYGYCGFDTLLAASLYIRHHFDPAFAPTCDDLLTDLEETYEFENMVMEAQDILASAEAGVPMEDILA